MLIFFFSHHKKYNDKAIVKTASKFTPDMMSPKY